MASQFPKVWEVEIKLENGEIEIVPITPIDKKQLGEEVKKYEEANFRHKLSPEEAWKALQEGGVLLRRIGGGPFLIIKDQKTNHFWGVFVLRDLEAPVFPCAFDINAGHAFAAEEEYTANKPMFSIVARLASETGEVLPSSKNGEVMAPRIKNVDERLGNLFNPLIFKVAANNFYNLNINGVLAAQAWLLDSPDLIKVQETLEDKKIEVPALVTFEADSLELIFPILMQVPNINDFVLRDGETLGVSVSYRGTLIPNGELKSLDRAVVAIRDDGKEVKVYKAGKLIWSGSLEEFVKYPLFAATSEKGKQLFEKLGFDPTKPVSLHDLHKKGHAIFTSKVKRVVDYAKEGKSFTNPETGEKISLDGLARLMEALKEGTPSEEFAKLGRGIKPEKVISQQKQEKQKERPI